MLHWNSPAPKLSPAKSLQWRVQQLFRVTLSHNPFGSVSWQWHLHSLSATGSWSLPIKHILEKKFQCEHRMLQLLCNWSSPSFMRTTGQLMTLQCRCNCFCEPGILGRLWRTFPLKGRSHSQFCCMHSKASSPADQSYKAGGSQFHLIIGTPNGTELLTREIKYQSFCISDQLPATRSTKLGAKP